MNERIVKDNLDRLLDEDKMTGWEQDFAQSIMGQIDDGKQLTQQLFQSVITQLSSILDQIEEEGEYGFDIFSVDVRNLAICDGCQVEIEHSEVCYCEECHAVLNTAIDSLEGKVNDLESELEAAQREE